MRLKNFLIESAYFPGMLIATWLTVSSCAAHAQTRPRTPDSVNQRFVYMRGDTVFQRNSNGVEEPLLPPSVYHYHIDSLEAELYLYKPKPGVIIIELDTTSNKMVYRKKIGYVKITNFYDDSLWVTDSIFVTASRRFPVLQSLNKPKFGWITDSIKWVPIDTTFEGESNCQHDWVYGEPDIAGYGFATYSCLVYHPPGQHCDFYNDVREKICRHCLHSEIEREQWYQRFVAPPKSEFERLKEKQRAKQ